ncbi:hypothetical protein A6A04_17920 [Paramagnetospirillum marisnigri]|uniref:Uncharacterized protein n=1 Tax=Paramagnetospirillum marisnigri TaxID=1285242 RepID=A0A178MP60_9PROT|nr:hypothetical protein [Paramagnetospirillum marisnigri]OAN50580.1 hypothetical protein A6A04_17920 [Paramagnetospirillum marisnigri]
MSDDTIRHPEEAVATLATINAPWSREITFQQVDHDSGLKILRMRIKEGRARFTIIDLDQPTVAAMRAVMDQWSGG